MCLYFQAFSSLKTLFCLIQNGGATEVRQFPGGLDVSCLTFCPSIYQQSVLVRKWCMETSFSLNASQKTEAHIFWSAQKKKKQRKVIWGLAHPGWPRCCLFTNRAPARKSDQKDLNGRDRSQATFKFCCHQPFSLSIFLHFVKTVEGKERLHILLSRCQCRMFLEWAICQQNCLRFQNCEDWSLPFSAEKKPLKQDELRCGVWTAVLAEWKASWILRGSWAHLYHIIEHTWWAQRCLAFCSFCLLGAFLIRQVVYARC